MERIGLDVSILEEPRWTGVERAAAGLVRALGNAPGGLEVLGTLGEFGVVLMIGGNIPGRTRVVSIAIYDHVETLSYSEAHVLAAVLLVFSFVLLLSVFVVNRRLGRVSFS